MTHIYAFGSQPLAGKDLDLLQGTLQKWCAEQGISTDNPKAQQAAVELIDWFQFGLRYEEELIEMIRRS